MLSYIVNRLIGMVAVMFIVATVVFVIIRVTPGDPAAVMLQLHRTGFDGFLLDDHVPKMDDDTEWNHRGRAHACLRLDHAEACGGTEVASGSGDRTGV